jgi:hypothetical protein
LDGVTSIYTSSEIMKIGLRQVGYSTRRIRRAGAKKNIQRFSGHFGILPLIATIVWEDLQTTEVEAAKVPGYHIIIISVTILLLCKSSESVIK